MVNKVDYLVKRTDQQHGTLRLAADGSTGLEGAAPGSPHPGPSDGCRVERGDELLGRNGARGIFEDGCDLLPINHALTCRVETHPEPPRECAPRRLRPIQQGIPLAKDAWLLGIGLSLIADPLTDRD